MNALEERLINLEIIIANQERTFDDLSAELLRQGKIIDQLTLSLKETLAKLTQSEVSTASEDVPPPHW